MAMHPYSDEAMLVELITGNTQWRGMTPEARALDDLVSRGLVEMIEAEKSINGRRQYKITEAGEQHYIAEFSDKTKC